MHDLIRTLSTIWHVAYIEGIFVVEDYWWLLVHIHVTTANNYFYIINVITTIGASGLTAQNGFRKGDNKTDKFGHFKVPVCIWLYRDKMRTQSDTKGQILLQHSI